MTGSAKPELVLAREEPSDSSRDKTYRVSVFSDGSATCACANYIIQGVNRGNLGHRCKHSATRSRDQRAEVFTPPGLSYRPDPISHMRSEQSEGVKLRETSTAANHTR